MERRKKSRIGEDKEVEEEVVEEEEEEEEEEVEEVEEEEKEEEEKEDKQEVGLLHIHMLQVRFSRAIMVHKKRSSVYSFASIAHSFAFPFSLSLAHS